MLCWFGHRAFGDQGPGGRAADGSIRQRTTSVGVRQFKRGSWGVAGVELVNPRDETASVVTGLYFDGDPMTQFSRRVRVPAHAIRRTWIPVQSPANGPVELSVRHFLYRHDDSARTLLRSSNAMLLDAERLPRATSPVTVIVNDWDVDDTESLTKSKELAIAMRLAARYTRNITELNPDELPAFQNGLDAVDHLVLAGNRIADSPAGLSTIRTWLQHGGRLWILLDQVDMRTVELLLGDAARITEVARLRLTDVNLQNLVKDEPSGSLRRYDDPVELVCVIAPDVDVIHEVDGWPASFRQDVGQGRVVFTTLSADAWMRPRLPNEQAEQLDRNSRFVALQGLREVADYLTRPLDPPPLTPQDFEPILSEQVGYRIPDRGTVLSILGLFWAGLIGVGFWLLHTARLERLALIGPLMACFAAAPLAMLGNRARRAIPPSAAVAELVQVGPGTTAIHSTGAATVFVPESTDARISLSRGRRLIPSRDRLEGSVRQSMWTDLDDWHWEHLTLPTGVHFATTKQNTSVATPLQATATFGPAGLYGQLKFGPYLEPSDALIATKSLHAISLHVEPNGRFSAGKADLLEPGVYLTDPLLTDEQRRRNVIYKKMLQPRLEFKYPKRPVLLAWTRPVNPSLKFPDGVEHSQSALLAVPLEIQPPPPDTEIFIPSPFLTFESVPTADGTKTTAHDPRTRQWRRTSYPTVTRLRFSIPESLLPLQPIRATLYLRIRAPLRTVTLATGGVDGLVHLASLENAVGSYEFPIEQPDALQLDEHGGLHVQLTVSDLQLEDSEKGNFEGIDRTWKMDFIRLELYGRTAEGPVQDRNE